MSANVVCFVIFLAVCAAVYWLLRHNGRSRFVAAFLSLCGYAFAQTPPSEPEVDMAEIRRLGDHVQYVDGDAKTSAADYVEVMGPPADDNHKWFISVIGSKGCAACARLKADLKTNEYLRALITVHENDDNHSDTRSSWAHYTYYLHDDASQKFRWKELKITGYPTILVQPPLNKKYGDPSTVVLQIKGYDGDGKKLATGIAAGIKAYLARQAEVRQAGHRAQLVSIVQNRDQGSGVGDQGIQLPPEPPAPRTPRPESLGAWGQIPWNPAPKVEPAPAPSPYPAPTPDGLLPPLLDWPPKPQPGPAPAPAPAPAPTPDAPNDAIPQTPEAVIVCDTNLLSKEDEARIRPVIDRLRKERPGLAVRIADLRNSKHLPVKADELPAIVVTSDGAVDEKVSARLFPLFQPSEAAAPVTTPTTLVAPPFPWEEVAGAVLTGGSVPAVVTAVFAVFIWWRTRRKAAGEAVIAPNVPIEQFAPFISEIITQTVTRVMEAIKPKDPAK